jgi:hypothetical protein
MIIVITVTKKSQNKIQAQVSFEFYQLLLLQPLNKSSTNKKNMLKQASKTLENLFFGCHE